MKKIINVITLLLLISTFFITGCKKEEAIKSEVQNLPQGQNTSSNIDELIKKTGIDIYALASSPELLTYFERVAPISEEVAANMDMKPSKSMTEEETIARMEELVALISQAAQNYDYDLVDMYFNELLSLTYGETHPWVISEEAFSEGEVARGLIEAAQPFIEFLDSEYPTFFTLNSEQQNSIIDAVIDIFIEKKPINCYGNYNAAIEDAEARFAIGIGVCALVGGGGPGSWACAAGVLGYYIVEHRRANNNLKACLGH